MSEHGRFAFEPLLNVVTGSPVGMEVRRCQARDQVELIARTTVWGSRQLAEFDSGVAIASVLHGVDYDASVPVHVDVLADTVVGARRRIRQLRSCLATRDGGRSNPPLLLEINPALAAAPPEPFREGVAELRADGFGIGLDAAGRGFGLDLVATLEPDLVKVDRALVAALPGSPRARTVVRALTDVCREVGVRVAAVGVSTVEELAAVRDQGIPWAQGPLLAGLRRRPSTAGVMLAVELMPHVAGRLHAAAGRPGGPSPAPRRRPAPPSDLPTVAALAQAPVALPDDATADRAREALSDHPQAGSVVLLDADRRPTGFLDRNRFMLAISGPYGRALHAYRPASELAEEPRTVPARLDVRAAAHLCLTGDRTRTLDDVVVVDGEGRCTGVVRVRDVLRDAATGPPVGDTAA